VAETVQFVLAHCVTGVEVVSWLAEIKCSMMRLLAACASHSGWYRCHTVTGAHEDLRLRY
jgi:hypothetical protein